MFTVAGISETYDGTSFTTNATLGVPGQRGGKSGTSTAAIAVGGLNPAVSANLTSTEEFTGETTSLNYKNISSS